jgi:hypothetical protein
MTWFVAVSVIAAFGYVVADAFVFEPHRKAREAAEWQRLMREIEHCE